MTASSSGSRLGASGRPGGRSGNARHTTPTGPVVAAVRQATRAPDERPPVRSGRPSSATVAQLLDDRDPGGVELRRRRRRAPSRDPVGLLHERDGDVDGERSGRGGDEIRRRHPSPGPVPEHERRARLGGRVQVGSRGAVRGVELEHVRLLCPLFAGRRGFSWCGDCSCCAQAWSRCSRSPVRRLRPVAAAGSIADARCDPAPLDRARPTAARSRAQNGGLPAAPSRLLRRDGLASADDEAGGDGVAVRAVLHLRPAARRPTSRSCVRTRRTGSARSGLHSMRSLRST